MDRGTIIYHVGEDQDMKKFDEIMEDVDQKVDRKLSPFYRFMQRYFTVFSVTLLSVLMLIFIGRIFYSRPYFLASIIKEDLVMIDRCLAKIDKECNILDIRPDNATIDFLTVEKFVGSMVGCLNLAYPERWKGPYVRVTPTLQSRPYEIVHTHEGLFIVPGKGTKLPNGLVINKDFKCDYQSSIIKMIKPGGQLHYKGEAFAIQLKFKVGDWDSPRLTPETMQKANKFLDEFNKALPYTENNTKDMFENKLAFV